MIKKLLFTTLMISIVLSIFGNFNHVLADNKIEYNSSSEDYPYACSLDYEVDYINDDGSLKLVECYGDFNSAKTKMKENKDYVVRNIDGYSPSKIVAMNSGLAYSFNRGIDDVVINIYEGVKGKANNTETYVDRYFEMNYIETNYMTDVSSRSGQGYIHVMLNGFEGYADLEYTDLVPTKYIDNKLPIYLGGAYGGNDKSPYKVICEPDYYVIEDNGKYTDLVLYYHNAYPKNAGSNDYNAKCWSMSIGNAQDYPFLNKNTKYYSSDGVNFYNNYKMSDRTLVGTGYNYYQFLPLRTKSNISASTLDNYLLKVKGNGTDSIIKNKGSLFIQGQETYGSNAAIVYSMACWESSYGTSTLARQCNNLFGWRAYDSNPGAAYTFNSVDDCILEHAGGNLRDYSDIDVSWFNGAYLGNKGSGFNLKYASDPYWGAGIASVYYRLDKYACGDNGQLKDYHKYDLGIVKTLGANVYSDSACKNVLFQCKYSATRNLNYFVTLLEDLGATYKIQLSNPITNGTLLRRVDGKYAYDWNKSIGFVKKSDVNFVMNNHIMNIENNPSTLIDSISYNNETLIFEGVGIISNCDFTNSGTVSHHIKIINSSDNSVVTTINCENTDSSWYKINDGNIYTYGGFKGAIDLSSLENGNYQFTLLTSARCGGSTVNKETVLYSTLDEYRNCSKNINGSTYRLFENDIYKYRIELAKEKNYEYIDFSIITKPTIKTSLATIDEVTYDGSVMNINGVGMMYYIDYSNETKIHTLYLVNNEHCYELDTTSIKSAFDYKSFYNSKYNMDYITFAASIDCKDIDTGTYHLVLKIENGNYIDFCELNNEFNYEYDALDIENIQASYTIDTIRSRMLFNIINEVSD